VHETPVPDRLTEIGPWRTDLSERGYQNRGSLGDPYLSPDKDRIAYVLTTSSLLGRNPRTFVVIASLDGFIVPYLVAERESACVSPIGWTPDGEYFYFRTTNAGVIGRNHDALVAIDRIAQTTMTVIDDFSPYCMKPCDFAEDGRFVSLVSRQGRDRALWLMNTTTKKMTKIASLTTDEPVRAWSCDGKHFAYVSLPEKDETGCVLIIMNLDGEKTRVLPGLHLPRIEEMKWSPNGESLLLKTMRADGIRRLDLINTDDRKQVRTIVPELPALSQYSWLGNDRIVFTNHERLIAVDTAHLEVKRLFPRCRPDEKQATEGTRTGTVQ